MSRNNEKVGPAVIIAVIGAIATIGTACVTGFFGMVPVLMSQSPGRVTAEEVAQAATSTTAPTAAPTATETSTPTLAPSPSPTVTPTNLPTAVPTPLPRLLFASQVAANGLALDPDLELKAGITDLYAVFPAGITPPGTILNVDDPEEGAYYAFLKVNEDSLLSSIGWRWIYEGQIVNEYDMEVVPGNDIWLGYSNYQEGGIFGAPPFPPGEYTIVITLGGSPFISEKLTILP